MKRLTETELAQRWDVTTRTLQNWRKTQKGPPFIRIGERSIFYREEDVLAYEDASVKGRLDEPRWRPAVKRAAAAIDLTSLGEALKLLRTQKGIVTPDAGLMNPNHFLAVAIDYLFTHRPAWREDARVGKTLVSSSMINHVVTALGRELWEVPVGFKWFVPGLIDGSVGFGGEESAGASFLRMDGSVWTTDKDGILLCLLAAEILAVTGRTPSQLYRELVAKYGDPAYERVDAPATREMKAKLSKLDGAAITATELAGDPIVAKLSHAPGNGAAFGGVKVETEFAWFAARPSGTEDVYKIYAESFKGAEHLAHVQREAIAIVDAALYP